MVDTAISDVDGTLVDTNHQHALAWYRAFRRYDIIQTALAKVEGASGVMVGDSTWDAISAGKLDVPTLAVRTGGFSAEELTEAGASTVVESLQELRDRLDDTPLSRPSA